MEGTLNRSLLSFSRVKENPILSEVRDFVTTVMNYEIWLYLAWNDVKSRYRRTVIGPFWLVIANAITIIGMALIWSLLFHMELKEYFPKLTSAMICWTLISYTITESGGTFINQGSIIQNLPVSIFLHPLRLLSRNVITFLHNFLIFICVAIFFRVKPTLYTLLFFPFFCLIVINLFSAAFIFGIIGARYRDFPQIVVSLMSVLIFVTPVMWDVTMLGNHYMLAYLNPLTHLLFVIKMPLLGELPPTPSILFILTCTVVNFFLMIFMSKKYGARIAYWV